MSEDQSKFEGWAKVEVMGHRTHFGYVTTVYFGTAGFFRVDIPALPEEEQVTQVSRYGEDGTIIPKGSKVRRPAIAGGSPLVACGSIYQMTPCTEEAAIEAIKRSVQRPLILVDLAKIPQIEASVDIPTKCAACGESDENCCCFDEEEVLDQTINDMIADGESDRFYSPSRELLDKDEH